jgi:sugar phosphate isomerase/epimerase
MIHSHLSITEKFLTQGVDYFYSLVDKNVVDGLDINVRSLETLNSFKEAKHFGGLNYSIHSDLLSCCDSRFQNSYLDFLKYQNTLNVTVHPSLDGHKIKNLNTLASLLTSLDTANNGINFSLENVNNYADNVRPNKYGVEFLLHYLPNLFFTFDVGHNLLCGSRDYNLDTGLKEKTKVLHIHDIVNNVDHYPFCNSTFCLDSFKSSNLLTDFDGVVVFELAFDYLKGDSLKEKMRSFNESVEMVRTYCKF